MSSQIIPLKARADSQDRAEFRPWRPLAFELQRRGYAARDWVLPGSSAAFCTDVGPVKANGAARKARERDKRATETRLRGCVRSPRRTGLACSSLKKCK